MRRLWRRLTFLAADLGWPGAGAALLMAVQVACALGGHTLPVWIGWWMTAVVLVACYAAYLRVKARHETRERIWRATRTRRGSRQ
jgi:hypothetical protein